MKIQDLTDSDVRAEQGMARVALADFASLAFDAIHKLQAENKRLRAELAKRDA